VVSATRTPRKLAEAPSIVSLIGREEILRLGYRTLEEALRNAVGFEVNQNGHWPDTGVRGLNDRTTYGDKIQFLVDGHDMSWRQFNRNFHNLSWVALDEVARIELVRGPGSALWGANALNGVVNIVTREWSNQNTAEMVLGADHRFASQQLFARAGISFGDLSLYTAVNYFAADNDALLAPLREAELLGKGSIRVEGDQHTGIGLNVKARWRWLRLSFHKSRFDANAPLSTFSIVGGDDSRFITDRHIVILAAELMPAAGLELRGEFHFDDYRFADGTVYEANPGDAAPGDPAVEGPGRYLRKMAAIDRRYEWKLQASWVPTLAFQALAGAEVELLDLVRWYFPEVWDHDALPLPTFTNWHLGTFAQIQYTPFSLLGITGGVRFDYDQIYRAVVAPRAGLVLRLPRGFALKGLFGMAFKAPSFHDLYYFRKNAFYGNPELKPEGALTGEGQLIFRHGGIVDLRVTGFITRINNLIVYEKRLANLKALSPEAFPASQLPDGTKDYSQKANKDYVMTSGVEAEASLTPHRRLQIQASGTYRRPVSSSGERLPYSSQWTAGGALSFRVVENLQASLRGLGVGNRIVPAQALSVAGFPSWTAAQDPTLEAPAYFVASFVLRLSQIFGKNLSATVKLDNVTNTDTWDAGREVLYPQRRFQGMVWLAAGI
jgi:iron complex outermembrane receptor protein